MCPQGVSLAQARDKGQLVFLEGLKESLSTLTPQETSAESQAMDFLRYKHTVTSSCLVLFLSHLHSVRTNVSALRDPAAGLKSLYEFVRSSVSGSGSRGAVAEGAEEEWGPLVLLVDDLSVLLSLGVSVGAVLDFSHYCRATICSQLQV